ncbi:esterase FE4-like isoform X1 [Schistocerca nitens]|uniref:esterase FE4-like isoform X1 n=2 Tax=Schistocerca nitens TaxID=7011 RepID=UPI0021189704|nr:esterase FE4-like isoform X1 [Schistocerca nitens]
MMILFNIFCLTYAVLSCTTLEQVQGAERIFKTVDTPLGPIRGRQFNTTSGNPVFIFRGVPYAQPPVGALRFKPPVPLTPWTERKDALQTPERCIQLASADNIMGSEDCLYLNIFSPELPSNTSTPRPVFVMIHGGGFRTGYAQSYSPDFYVDSGILVVSIQYRLGPLGFMSTGDLLLPGNLGMKDQVLALQWIQQNIAAFGGNPDDVTINGQSAGGASVHFLVLSPMSKGLFKQAISQSGCALNPWAFKKNTTDRTFRYVSYLGYEANTTSDLMNFLMNVEAEELVKYKSVGVSEEDRVTFFMTIWIPTLEPEHEGAFLTEEPQILMSEGRYNYVPYLAGITSYELLARTQEGGVFASEEDVKNLNDNFDAYVAHELRLSSREEQLRVSAEIRQFYYGDNEITLQLNDSTAKLASDLSFTEGVDTVIRNMSRSSPEPVYYYQFSFNGPLNVYPDFPGACHGDDTRYAKNYVNLETDSAGYKVGLQLLHMWANFVKYSDPTPVIDELLTEDWNQYETNNTNYLEFVSPLYTGTGLNKERMDFWHTVMP